MGNNTLQGGTGSDSLVGEDGNDLLIGVNALGINPGQGEIDTLTGGLSNDTFALGDANNIYYNDGNSSNQGMSDYALIKDFTQGEDTIQLQGGNALYLLATLTNGSVGIFVDNPSFNTDELLGIVQGIDPSTLTINYGSAITTIT